MSSKNYIIIKKMCDIEIRELQLSEENLEDKVSPV